MNHTILISGNVMCVMYLIEISSVDIIAMMFIDKNGDNESLLPVVIVLAVIAIVAIIVGVILLILHIRLRAVIKRSYCLCF